MRRAAERCHVSQPTLSGQLKKLEQSLGVELFERTTRGLLLTPVGERIVDEAQRLLALVDTIEAIAQSERNPLAGSLRLGAIHTVSPYLVPLFFGEVASELPELRLIMSEGMTHQLVRSLLDHELDAAILATVEEPGELDSIPLYQEPFWFACPVDHPFAQLTEPGKSELDQAELLLLADGHCLTGQVIDLCRRDGRLKPEDRADLRVASLETLLGLVGKGLGCTLVPALAVENRSTDHDRIRIRRLAMDGASRRVSLVYRRSYPRQGAITALAALIRSQLPEGVEPLGDQGHAGVGMSRQQQL